VLRAHGPSCRSRFGGGHGDIVTHSQGKYKEFLVELTDFLSKTGEFVPVEICGFEFVEFNRSSDRQPACNQVSDQVR